MIFVSAREILFEKKKKRKQSLLQEHMKSQPISEFQPTKAFKFSPPPQSIRRRNC